MISTAQRLSRLNLCRVGSIFRLNKRTVSAGDFLQISNIRKFCKVTDSRAIGIDSEEIFESGSEDPLANLRNYLYPESDDHHVVQLSNASSVQEVFECLHNLGEAVGPQHLAQAAATLFYLQKLCHDDDKQFMARLRQRPEFDRLVGLCSRHLDEFPLEEIAFLLLAFRRFSLPLSSPLLTSIQQRLSRNLDVLDAKTLSYMSVAMRNRYGEVFWYDEDDPHPFVWRTALAPAMARVQQLLDQADSPEELRRIAIIFVSLSPLVSNAMMNSLAEKVKVFISRGLFNSDDRLVDLRKLLTLVICKLTWHEDNVDYVNLLLMQYKDKLHLLEPIHLITFCTIMNIFRSPGLMIHQLVSLLKQTVNQKGAADLNQKGADLNRKVSLVSEILEFDPHAFSAEEVESQIREYLGISRIDSLGNLYSIFRSGMVRDLSLYDQYFALLFEIADEPSELARLANRYARMSTNYGDVYKNEALEEKLLKRTHEYIERTLLPAEFASLLGVLLNLGQNISDRHYERFTVLLGQMRPGSLFTIACGLESQLRQDLKRGRRHTQLPRTRDEHSQQTERLEDISVSLSQAVVNLVDTRTDFSTSELFFLFRCLIGCRSVSEETSFDAVISRLREQISSKKSSGRYILSFIKSLGVLKPVYEIPGLLDSITEQIVPTSACEQDFHASLYHHYMYLSFRCNRAPPAALLHTAGRALLRDFHLLNGRSSLEFAIALAYFDALPEGAIRALFSVEFMSRLDKEVSMCRKPSYVEKVRRLLMLLNRLVVLERPEAGVTWFHERYCQENLRRLEMWFRDSQCLKSDVSKVLSTALGSWRHVRENTYSKYYNYVDFEVVLDRDGRPVDLYSFSRAPEDATRLAVQVPSPALFTADTKKLNGYAVLNSRQLQKQGWQVVHVNPFTWNSMQMEEADAKMGYLRQKMSAVV